MNVIINGPGRSGTTLLSQLFSYHKDFTWISGWLNRYPNLTKLTYFNFLYRSNLFGIDISNLPKTPKPAEAYNFWNHYINNFNDNTNPSSLELKRLSSVIKKLKVKSNKPHFVTKITGDLRKNVFDNIFENYELIWIERDPRVVVSSYIKQRWFYKEQPKEYEKLDKIEKIKFYSNYYINIYNKAKVVPKRIVYYENLCKNPQGFMSSLFNELELDFSEYHASKVREREIKEIGWSHYKNKYTKDQIKLLNKLLEEPLSDYKYIL
jgi:hypothetical protein